MDIRPCKKNYMFLVGSRVTFSNRTTFLFYFLFLENLQNHIFNICQIGFGDAQGQTLYLPLIEM